MAFTDDDIKKLENGYWFKRVPIANVGQSESWVWCDGDKIVELLCRLKAAEACLLDVWHSSIADEKLAAWNRARGDDKVPFVESGKRI